MPPPTKSASTRAAFRASRTHVSGVLTPDYILSDPVRRKEYDEARQTSPPGGFSSTDQDDQDSSHFFRSFGTNTSRGTHAQPQPEQQFAETWEELLRPEMESSSHLWKYAGTVAGSVLGYIFGNIPGALGGGLVGGKMGSIRDAKGKSVSEVFLHLREDQRAQILRQLAIKVLGSI